ncbi:hypothetical protein GQ44DRAFT_777367 [Phaeosphaeriaceae sp. PMI808]|nr:hypothetical protein GQ44DRAFT_777367 [Phaeosphaeriaceae sp. PMI808]
MTPSLFAHSISRSQARDPKYWRQNLEKPVLFSQAMTLALAGQKYHVIEVGPHSTFKITMEDISRGLSRDVRYSPTVIRCVPPVMTIMQLTGSMFLDGFDAPIQKINGPLSPFASGKPPVVVTNLAPYPWKRGPVLWSECRISSDVQWLRDHRLWDVIVFPAAGYITTTTKGFRQIMSSRGIVLKSVLLCDIKFLAMLTLDAEDTAVELFTKLCPIQNSLVHPSQDKFSFTISNFASNISTIH